MIIVFVTALKAAGLICGLEEDHSITYHHGKDLEGFSVLAGLSGKQT
jgi:hypothetical protein